MSVGPVVGILVALGVLLGAPGRGRGARAVAGLRAAPRTRRGGPGGRRWGPGPVRGRDEGEPVVVVVARVAALLRAGASPGGAWGQAVGVRVDADGVPDAASLVDHVGGVGRAEAVVAACRLAGDVGAPLAEVLEEVAALVADEARAAGERAAAFAGPRTTIRILGWLPVVGILLGLALGADPIATAFDGRAGTVAMLLGVAFLLAGRRWSGRLLRGARAVGEGT